MAIDCFGHASGSSAVRAGCRGTPSPRPKTGLGACLRAWRVATLWRRWRRLHRWRTRTSRGCLSWSRKVWYGFSLNLGLLLSFYRFPIFETSATALCGTTGMLCCLIYSPPECHQTRLGNPIPPWGFEFLMGTSSKYGWVTFQQSTFDPGRSLRRTAVGDFKEAPNGFQQISASFRVIPLLSGKLT